MNYMHKIIFLILSIFISCAIRAQMLEHRLTGCWKVVQYVHEADTFRFETYWDMYNFSPYGTFKMLQSNLGNEVTTDTVTHFLQSGKYSERDSILKFSHVKEYQKSDGYFLFRNENRIAVLNDSLLQFEIQYSDTDIYRVDYKPVSQEEWEHTFSHKTGVWIIPAENYSAQDFHLENSLHPNRRKKIAGNYSLTFNFIRIAPSPDSIQANIQWLGMVKDVNDSSITMSVYNETTEYYDSLKNAFISYSTEYDIGNPLVKTAPLSGAEIAFTPPGAQVVNGIGSGIFTTSILTALVIAPLASIQYKQGGFNEKLYLNMAGYSLGTALVMVPVILPTMEKTYAVTTKSGIKSKRHWRVVY